MSGAYLSKLDLGCQSGSTSNFLKILLPSLILSLMKLKNHRILNLKGTLR